MNEPTTVTVQMTFNLVENIPQIEYRKRPDGDYDLIGVNRRREYNSKTGFLISDETSFTGALGWAPRETVEGYTPSWWSRLFGATWCLR